MICTNVKTGKTYIAEALATRRTNCSFFSISVSDIRKKWHGESENRIKMIFQMARKSPGTIIFIDEVDSLCKDRSNADTDSLSKDVLSELLVQLDGFGKKDDNFLLVGATNLPMQMDSAMIRRFDAHVYIPLPDREARETMVRNHLQNTHGKKMTDEDYVELSNLTMGASGSDIKNLVKKALHEPLIRCKGLQQYWKCGGDWVPRKSSPYCVECPEPSSRGRCSKCRSKWMSFEEIPSGTLKTSALCMDDFTRALKKWRITVHGNQLEQYEMFHSKRCLDKET